MCLPPFISCVLSLALWAQPQPTYSAGMIFGYGSEQTALANANYRGYTLDGYAGGGASISPAMLGRIMWARVEGGEWIGPLLVVDAVAQADAAASIFDRHEIAELPRGIMAQLGTDTGTWGFIFFGSCPPPADSLHYPASRYAPVLTPYQEPYTGPRSFAPYPAQQTPTDCPE